MLLQLDYAGRLEEVQPSFEHFNDLHPMAVRKWESLSPTGIQPAAGQNIGSGIWYKVTANRRVYDLFKQIITEHPDFNRCVGQFESYAQQGAKAINLDSTAHANRDDDILVYETTSLSRLSIRLPPQTTLLLRNTATKARAIWHAGDTPGRNVTDYLDYANGDEALEARDGYEIWRLE
ncbi:MAG: hypothetical protein Q9180_005100 [Flavoplaca navasiana]